ncbi:MAG TPA: alpha/beta hydrolase [Thermoanaerobaculia bacterium]|nr:alpha/beta hydrolase [Thermoanaerobaculia bacterium]
MPATARILLLLVLFSGCHLRPATVPLRTIEVEPGVPGSRLLVVLLPGRRDSPEDFARFGWGELARKSGAGARIVAVDAHLGYYHRRTILDRLREDVIAPAQARGINRIWLAGVSLGGTGSILYSIEHPEDVRGIALFAPFLGEEEHRDPPDFQRRMWSWLEAGPATPIYLGWGTEDDFAPMNGLLGKTLPAERVFTIPGGHDWKTWTKLWELFLETGALK